MLWDEAASSFPSDLTGTGEYDKTKSLSPMNPTKTAGKALKPGAMNRLVLICLVLIFSLTPGTPGHAQTERRIIFQFKEAKDIDGWRVVPAAAAASGEINVAPSGALWFRGGGTGKIGSPIRLIGPATPLQLRAFAGLELRIQADGRRYSVLLHVASQPPGVTYQADFLTRDSRWITVFLPFSDFRPVHNDLPIRHWPQIDLSRLDRISFQIDSQDAGLFNIKIRSIAAKGH